jgi:hypothetical protein
MVTGRSRFVGPIVLLIVLGVSSSCGGGSSSAPSVDLGPFIRQARDAGCGNIRNTLYVIDDKLVLWDRAGNCPDNSYSQNLYGRTIDQVFCKHFDTIAGPKTEYYDEKYKVLFDTVVASLDKPDLGLGPEHSITSTSVLPVCTSNEDCLPAEFCAKAMGDCEGRGVCTAKPTVCPLAPVPLGSLVCGCDGRTYGYYIGACDAAEAGVNIAHKGSCE